MLYKCDIDHDERHNCLWSSVCRDDTHSCIKYHKCEIRYSNPKELSMVHKITEIVMNLFDYNTNDLVVGTASFTIDDEIRIYNIELHEIKRDGVWSIRVNYPMIKTEEGKYRPCFYPRTMEMKKCIESAIVDHYHAFEKMNKDASK